jgi:MFS family permease
MVARLLSGARLDRPGRKALLLAGLAVFALAGAAYGLARGFLDFLALRVLQGLGWGLVVTGIAAIVADLAPPARRGEAIGYWGLAPTLAMAVGPWAGSVLYAARGAKPVFLCAAALGLGAIVFLLPIRDALRPDQPARASFSLPREARLPAGVLLLSSLSYGALVAFLPVELATQPGRAGVFFSLYALAILVSRPLAGGLSDRLGRAAVIHPGLALGAAGALLLGFAAHPLVLPVAAVLYGAGIGGASFPGLMALAVDRCPPGKRAAGIAVFFSAYDVAIAAGSALLGPVYETFGFLAMNVTAAACVAASQALLWWGLRRPRREPA